MTEQASSFFNQDWLETQREYWNTWWKLSQQAMSQVPQAAGNPSLGVPGWSEALDLWWKAVNPAVPASAQETFQRFLDQGKNYFQFNEAFLKGLQNFSAGGAGGDWQKLWNETAEQMKESFSKLAVACTTPGGLLGCWELPLDNWGRTVSSLSVFPGDFLKGLKHGGTELPGTAALQENIQRLLSVPSVGYTREWQEQVQAAGKLWLEYQQAQEEYAEIFKRLGVRTVDRLGEKLRELSEKGDAITGLRALYDVWVDCGEDVYAELTSTDEYAKINARMVNSLMAWKRHGHQMVDEMLEMLSMPTREELDTLHLRMQQMRRDTKSLQESAVPEVGALLKEVQALRQEVAALKAADGPAPAAKPAARTAKKPAAKTGE